MRRLRLRRVMEEPPRPVPGPLTLPLVCALTSVTHEIADTEFTRAVSGRYRAVCGAVVAASPMCVPEGRRCERCTEALARAQARHGHRAMRRPA